jgi:hypothetical protein
MPIITSGADMLACAQTGPLPIPILPLLNIPHLNIDFMFDC